MTLASGQLFGPRHQSHHVAKEVWENSKQSHIPHEILSLQRFARGGEVSLRQLNKEAREEFDIAKSAEIQSRLRYEALTAAL